MLFSVRVRKVVAVDSRFECCATDLAANDNPHALDHRLPERPCQTSSVLDACFLAASESCGNVLEVPVISALQFVDCERLLLFVHVRIDCKCSLFDCVCQTLNRSTTVSQMSPPMQSVAIVFMMIVFTVLWLCSSR